MSQIVGWWMIGDKLKGIIIIVLLLALFGLGLMMFQKTEKEGFDTEPIRYSAQKDLANASTTGVQMSVSDSDNGYYILYSSPRVYLKSANDKIQMGKLPYGYYKASDDTMSKIPYGYELEKQGLNVNDKTDYLMKIVPKTDTAKYKTDPSQIGVKGKPVKIPIKNITQLDYDTDMDGYPNIEDIPDGYYKIDEQFMGLLPPNMKPKITKVLILGTKYEPILVKVFGIGYIPESEYYSKKYRLYTKKKDNSGKVEIQPNTVGNSSIPIESIAKVSIGTVLSGNIIQPTIDEVFPLPKGIYYTPPLESSETWTPNTVQFLPYGKMAKPVRSKADKNKQNGTFMYGYEDDPNVIVKGTYKYDQTYQDISGNYDVTFHDTVDALKEQNDMYDSSFGSITVLDKDGNLVVLPRSEIQGDITYYQPGSYTFGANTYIPSYEDSVYLSRTTQLPTMAEYRSAFKKVGFCEADKASPFTVEEKCNALDVDACASTSCCVLLGGSKCVSGTKSGPALKQNYGDVFIRNKDNYTHMGECYGNCP